MTPLRHLVFVSCCRNGAFFRHDSGRQSQQAGVLGLGALGIAGILGSAAAAARLWRSTGPAGHASDPSSTRASLGAGRVLRTRSRRSGLGDPPSGSPHAIEGYAGAASVLTGESFPLFVSTTSSGLGDAFRLRLVRRDGARGVWQSGPLRGHRQTAPAWPGRPTRYGPTRIPRSRCRPTTGRRGRSCSGWTRSGAQRYVPVTVRSPRAAGQVVIKNCVATWQAYNTWGGYDLYAGPGSSYGARSLAVSLDRPYDANGAAMLLTYERNVVKLAERIGLPLAYLTGMDIAADPHLLDGASALISPGHDEYWTPAERAHVTAARDEGVNLAFLWSQRDVPADQAGRHRARPGPARHLLQDQLHRGSDVRDRTTRSSPATGASRPDPIAGVLADRHPLRGLSRGRVLRGGGPGQLGVRRDRGGRGRPASATSSASSTTGSTRPTRCRGRSRSCRTRRWCARGRRASVIRPTTRTPAGPASSTRAPCAGWRRSSATARTASRR